MVNGLWGRKIGMTQLFSQENEIVPVTVIDVSHWYVTQVKNEQTDGYMAIQLGCVKKKYASESFNPEWLRKPATYFSMVREVAYKPDAESTEATLKVGDTIQSALALSKGDLVDVSGTTKGAGFQGVVKRHGFAGGPASHGATFGRFTGGLSFMRSEGRVIKGKRMPGHMGVDKVTVKNLEVIDFEPSNIVIVKGSVPGKSGSLVFVRKV